MKDLCHAAHVSKATVLHYVNEGLLPKPLKTSPNMAYYDPSCIERIAFIKNIQQKYGLPLEAIKRLLKERDLGRNISTLLELQEFIYGSGEGERFSMKEFSRATGLTITQVKAYVETGILIPLFDGQFDAEDVAVGKALKRSIVLGMTPEKASFYPRLAKEIVEAEMEMRKSLTADLPHEKDAAATLELTRTARALRSYVIDRFFQRRLLKTRGLKDHGK